MRNVEYCDATAIMAADVGPSQEPLARSDVTDLKEAAEDANSEASSFHAAAAASSGPEPGPANISAELISGGNHAKCGFVTNPNYRARPAVVCVSGRVGGSLTAADQLAGTGVGRHPVLGDHLAGNHGCDVALRRLIQATPAGGQVIADHRLVQA